MTKQDSRTVSGRVIAVTGASQGLGLAISENLINSGARVALLARNADALEEICARHPEQAQAFPTDVTDPVAVKASFDRIKESFGNLDGLVNNAGLARPNKLADVTPEELSLQLNTNISGLLYCCQAALPLLRESDNGRIVNISSASARSRLEIAHLGIYAATKAAVDRLSEELRDELREEGVAVTVLSPGATMTDFAAGFDVEKLQAATRAWHKKGKDYDGYMEAEFIGQAVVDCLAYPKGVCIDFVEIRPNKNEEKPWF
jgi:NADP-dependent 3-hydroxy acid dehydrogenase YdfG